MNQSQAEIFQLKLTHTLYTKVGKFVWVFTTIFLLASVAGLGATMYADYMGSDVRTAAMYGHAMSGGSVDDVRAFDTPRAGAQDYSGLFCMGIVGLALAIVARRKSKQFLALPIEVQARATADMANLSGVAFGNGRSNQPAKSEADEIAKLDALRKAGAITDTEFNVTKTELLKRIAG